ncbi:esterase/lipase family protein [Sinosporangium siamense]|nr:alpha/beta fold hydrolase [Sinosporangium siamense]
MRTLSGFTLAATLFTTTTLSMAGSASTAGAVSAAGAAGAAGAASMMSTASMRSTGAAVADPVPHGFTTFPGAFLASLAKPDESPPGANDWACAPSARRPVPVVLIHGTWANAFNVWNELAPTLKRDGYCVYALNYGGAPGIPLKATAPVPDSAKELAGFVDKVLTATGAAEVDLVGHSQGGGVMPRWYLKYHDGGPKVRKLIGLAPANHGTTVSGVSTLAAALGILGIPGLKPGDAGPNMFAGSEFNRVLDQGGDTVPSVEYVTVVSRYDGVVTPYTNQFLTAGPGAKVTNILLQNICPLDLTKHLDMTYAPAALQLVRNHLDPATARQPSCRPALPFISRLRPQR